jgi:hypothetical protein
MSFTSSTLACLIFTVATCSAAHADSNPYPIPPTGQKRCYGSSGGEIPCTARSGQDATHARSELRYRDNGDGTVSDLNSGLMWQKTPAGKTTWDEARAGARQTALGTHTDWRLPTIKELYSLIDFSGAVGPQALKPFIDTAYFDFRYGDTKAGERLIDAQYWSSTEYTGRTMGGNETVFGVNFADGRIKGYPKYVPGNRTAGHRMFVRYVRGNTAYGRNDFVDQRDGTVLDRATGLMWMQVDSGALKAGPFSDGRMNWPQALDWAAGLNYAGHTDWRLPNAKELQSIIDYRRSPAATRSAAIDPVFRSTLMRNETGRDDYAQYWTSTTHLDGPRQGGAAVYIAFGEALGYMRSPNGIAVQDVHGAGAQRSDPKQGDPSLFPQGRGPQGDVIRIYNNVRLVRNGLPGK